MSKTQNLDDSFTLTEERSEDFEVASASQRNNTTGSKLLNKKKNGGGNGSGGLLESDDSPTKTFDSSYNFQHLPKEEIRGSIPSLKNPRASVVQQQQQQPLFLLPNSVLPFRGRQAELSILHKSMERISLEWMENSSEIVWVSGPRGVGKTTLVQHASEKEGFEKALICRGHCEQYATATQPFNALSECLNDLCVQLLKNNQKPLWKSRLDDALGGEGPLVCTICPALAQLLDCTPMERRVLLSFDSNTLKRLERLAFAVRDLLQAVSGYQPLCMIVDNIQYADADSLKLMQELLSTKPLQNFLLIAIYDSTLPNNDALTQMKDLLAQDTTTKTNDIRLQAFTNDHLKDVLTQLFVNNHDMDNKDGNVMDLTEIAFALTKGNPLWVVHLLKLWNDQKLITHNSMKRWEWNRKKLKKEVKRWRDEGLECYKSCEGVLQARLQELPKKILFVVIVLAKLRLTHFRVDHAQFYRILIAAVYRKTSKTDKDPITSQDELEKMIQKACQYGLVKKRNRPGWYRFPNDSIRECAAALASPYDLNKKPQPNDAMKLQLYVGTELSNLATEAGKTNLEQRERYKFLAVEQFYACFEAMDETEKVKLAKINLEAAEIAIAKTAFQTAIVYLERAVAAVDHTVRWQQRHYDVTLRIFLFLARMRLCCGRNSAAKAASDEIAANHATLKDLVYSKQVLIVLLQQEKKYDQALQALLDLLKRLGEVFPEKGDLEHIIEREIGNVQKKVGAMENQQLLNPKKMTDSKAMDAMMVLASLVEVSHQASPNRYLELATLRMMHMSLQMGFTRQYPLAFSLFGVLLVQRGQIKEAHRVGQIAEKIARLTDFYGGEAVALFHWHISHWRRTYKRSLEPVLKIYNAQVDSGDFTHAGFSISTYIQYHLASGFDLEKLNDNLHLFQGLYSDYRLNDEWIIQISQQAVSNLMGESSFPLVFFGVTLAQQDTKVEEYRKAGLPQAIEYFYLLRLFLAFFFHDLDVMGECFEQLTSTVQGVWIPWMDFMECFMLIQYLPESKGKRRKELKEKIELLRNRLIDCYNEGNPNPNAMTSILEAEWVIAKEAGKSLSAMRAQEVFKAAVETAAKDGVTHLEAFASERAGRHFSRTGVEGFCAEYLTRSHKAYDRCQYVAKVMDLETNYGALLKITKRHVRPGSAYIEQNAIMKPSGKEIGGGHQEAKTVNLVKGIKKTAKRIGGVRKTSRKVKDLFKKEKAEPAPWGWSSKNKLSLDDEEGAAPGSPPKSPMKELSSRLLGRGKKHDNENDKEESPIAPLASPSGKQRTSQLFAWRGGKKKKNQDDQKGEDEVSPPTSPSLSKSPKTRPTRRHSSAPKAEDQEEEAIDDMLVSPRTRGSRSLKMDGPMNIPFGIESLSDEDVPTKKKDKKKTKKEKSRKQDK